MDGVYVRWEILGSGHKKSVFFPNSGSPWCPGKPQRVILVSLCGWCAKKQKWGWDPVPVRRWRMELFLGDRQHPPCLYLQEGCSLLPSSPCLYLQSPSCLICELFLCAELFPWVCECQALLVNGETGNQKPQAADIGTALLLLTPFHLCLWLFSRSS